jgi:hypothetical protein
MPALNYIHGKFFGTSGQFTGYALIAGGLVALFTTNSPVSMFIIVPGIFMAFTFSGTIVDTDKKRIKPYTCIFGVFNAGKWISLNLFTRFHIAKVTGRYTAYSRGNVRFDMDVSDVRLLLVNNDDTVKIAINKFKNFEEAQKAKEELSALIFPQSQQIK